jgi:hypothetical protein
MSKRKDVGQYGETHSFTLNEWKPTEEKRQETRKDSFDSFDLPF